MALCLSLVLLCVTHIKGMDVAQTALHNLNNKGYGGRNSIVQGLKRDYSGPHTDQLKAGIHLLTEQEISFLQSAVSKPSIFMEHKWDRPKIKVMQILGEDCCTSFSVDYNIDFPLLMGKIVSWPVENGCPTLNNGFQYAWNMGVFFPSRHLTVDAPPLLGFKWADEINKLIYSQMIECNGRSMFIDDIFKLYTEHKNYIHSVINIALTMHITDDIENQSSLSHLRGIPHYIKNLHQAICYQSAKDPVDIKTVYRGATMSALGLFMMKMKKIFYLPNFVSASLDEKSCYWDPIREENRKLKGTNNVKFVIDLSGYCKHATVIKDHQTKYPGEKEVLLSCYNLYRYVREEYNPENETFYVYLKVENAEDYIPEESYYKCISFETIGWTNGVQIFKDNDLDSWIGKRGELSRTTQITCYQLSFHFNLLNESFNRNFTIQVVKEQVDNQDKKTNQ